MILGNDSGIRNGLVWRNETLPGPYVAAGTKPPHFFSGHGDSPRRGLATRRGFRALVQELLRLSKNLVNPKWVGLRKPGSKTWGPYPGFILAQAQPRKSPQVFSCPARVLAQAAMNGKTRRAIVAREMACSQGWRDWSGLIIGGFFLVKS